MLIVFIVKTLCKVRRLNNNSWKRSWKKIDLLHQRRKK